MAGGGFEKQTKYSYGYIARATGTDFYKTEKTIEKVKGDIHGKLTLVERKGEKSTLEDTKNSERKSLTPKKFLLIGSNRITGEIEVTGLVSLIQFGHDGIKKNCGITEGEGAIQNGYCDKIIFREYGGTEGNTAPTFIKKELKNKEGRKNVSIIGLSQEKGNLGILWGSRKKDQVAKWSRTGYLYQQQTSGKKKIWTSLQQDQKVKGFFVVHDLIFSENALNNEWKNRSETYGTILGNKDRQVGCKSSSKNSCLKVVDIPLSINRKYWIWDPAKTIIKDGKFVTEEGIKLPFKIRFDIPWNSTIVK